jgi:hypothetical protein
MIRDHFRASVQYNDFKGSAAADRADKDGPEGWLEKKHLMKSGEFILGIEVDAGENHGVHRDPVTVHFFLVKGSFDSAQNDLSRASGPVPTRRVTVDIPIADFMGLFKRFSVTLSPQGMLHEKAYSFSEA